MDTCSDPQTQGRSAPKSTGCCGGKTEAQPQAKAEPRVVETAKNKSAKSGCGCGQN